MSCWKQSRDSLVTVAFHRSLCMTHLSEIIIAACKGKLFSISYHLSIRTHIHVCTFAFSPCSAELYSNIKLANTCCQSKSSSQSVLFSVSVFVSVAACAVAATYFTFAVVVSIAVDLVTLCLTARRVVQIIRLSKWGERAHLHQPLPLLITILINRSACSFNVPFHFHFNFHFHFHFNFDLFTYEHRTYIYLACLGLKLAFFFSCS